MFPRLARPLALFAAAAVCASVPPAAAQESAEARRAAAEGFKHLRGRDHEAARGPLEDARDLLLAERNSEEAPARALTDVQRALLSVYAELGEAGGVFDTGDWLMRNAARPAARSLTMRATLGYARGKRERDALRARYEKVLEAAPTDRVALRMLAAVAEADREPAEAAERLGQLIALDRETEAGADPRDRIERAGLLERAGEHEVAATEYGRLAAEAETLSAKAAEEKPAGADAPAEKTAENNVREVFGPSSTAGNLWVQAARNWSAADRTDEAREAADRAERLGDAGLEDPHPYYFHSFLGDVRLKLDDPGKALAHFQKALAAAANDPARKGMQQKIEAARTAISDGGD